MTVSGRWIRGLALAVGAIVVAGCNTVGPMHIPELAPAASATPARTGSLFDSATKPTLRLETLVAALRRGTVFAHFPARDSAPGGLMDYCNYTVPSEGAKLEWSAGTRFLGDWTTEFGRIFFEVMRNQGHAVVGDASRLFERSEKVIAAEYLIGGRIMEMRGNFCEQHSWWDGRPLDVYAGEAYLKVEWEVFSTLARRVVFKTTSEGVGKLADFKREGFLLAYHEAFADATERFGADTGLRALLEEKASGTQQADRPSGRPLLLAGRKPFRGAVKENRQAIVNAVVSIQLSNGHGSGFLISTDGYLLTNAHVVGDGKRVPVLFDNGLRVQGEVVRISKPRDVALIKVPVSSEHALPVVRAPNLKPLDDLFVVGSPFHTDLRTTITKGIVSALRRDRDGNTYIQSDAAITGGSSGGPMLDARGNVVGISVASFEEAQNLNYFIPIHSALEALNIQFD